MTTTSPKRANFKWNINEVLALQREYELLEWSVDEIASKHERSVDGIACKLVAEGFIKCRFDARGYLPALIDIVNPFVESEGESQSQSGSQGDSVNDSLHSRVAFLELSLIHLTRNVETLLKNSSNKNTCTYASV